MRNPLHRVWEGIHDRLPATHSDSRRTRRPDHASAMREGLLDELELVVWGRADEQRGAW
jgi:hypothetical protein